MRFKKLRIDDRPVFDGFLNIRRRELSAYCFANIDIWKRLFRIYWLREEDSLCVFFRDRLGVFLYLPPLAKQFNPRLISRLFEYMDKVNRNCAVSRIENIEEKEVGRYRDIGYTCREKYPEYVCRRQDLAQLKGNRYKSQRACRNFFRKHNDFQCRDFNPEDKSACRQLFSRWAQQRSVSGRGDVYTAMIQDAGNAFAVMLDDYEKLGLSGRVIEVKSKIKAVTFGLPINADTFCVVYEITDLSVKGAAQFIFQDFCIQARGYSWVNIMDDSGLENLRQAKLSCRPFKTVKSYIATKS